MRILQLVNRIPYPLNDGGNIGVYYYTQGFIDAGVQLSMLAMNTTRHWTDLSTLPELFQRLQQFKVVKVDNRIKPMRAFINLFQGSSYNIDRFVSFNYRKALIEMLQQNEFDIVQLEGLYLAPYIDTIRQFSKAKIVIRQHNVEFRIWERLTAQAKNPLKKWYLSLLTKRLKRYETACIHQYDLMLPISLSDQALLQTLAPDASMFLHPFGIDVERYQAAENAVEPISLYHIGAMDWLPNRESVDWLLEKVMPLVNELLPSTQLHLAGRNMPENYVSQQWKNVVVHGEVPDAKAFESDKHILLVPLLSGGGVRIKIFQAMAMGKAVVTTTIGVEGIDAANGKHLLIADTPEAFAECIVKLVKNTEYLNKLGNAARTLILEKYNSKQLINELLAIYGGLVR